MQTIDDLATAITRHAAADGIHATALPRLGLVRSSMPTAPMPVVYEPSICIVAQGTKAAQLGERQFRYDPAHYLIGAIDLPMIGRVVEASAIQPYLCVRLELDIAGIADLLVDHPDNAPQGSLPPGLMIDRATPELTDAAARLVRLLDNPADLLVLAPLVERELWWRLLAGPAGPMLRHLALADGRFARIGAAIRWLRAHYDQPVSVDFLADQAAMSPSAFHHQFKALTLMSPVQFRTRLRLEAARRLMVVDGLDAANAGFRVGYGSPSQFSRDYVRAFGVPPARDAAELRAAGPYPLAA